LKIIKRCVTYATLERGIKTILTCASGHKAMLPTLHWRIWRGDSRTIGDISLLSFGFSRRITPSNKINHELFLAVVGVRGQMMRGASPTTIRTIFYILI